MARQPGSVKVDWVHFSSLIHVALWNASKLTSLRVTSERWEEVLNLVFKELVEAVDWGKKPHAVGADIELSQSGKSPIFISVKSGKIKKPRNAVQVLKFSSYRLTSHKDVEERKTYIDQQSRLFQWYLCGARRETSKYWEYQIFVVKSAIIDASSANGGDTKLGWEGTQPNNVRLKIVGKLSDQLWVEIPISLLDNGPEQFDQENIMGARVATIRIPAAIRGTKVHELL